jgi:hypothetical protein
MRKLTLNFSDGYTHWGEVGIIQPGSNVVSWDADTRDRFLTYSDKCAFIILNECVSVYSYHSIVSVSQLTKEEYKQMVRDIKLNNLIKE